MAGELDDKIRDIGAMLGFADIPDAVTELIGSFLDQPENPPEICPNYEQESEQVQPSSENNLSDAVKMMELVQKYQSAKAATENDKNMQLLRALSPYLSKRKRKRIKNCEMMLTILKLL